MKFKILSWCIYTQYIIENYEEKRSRCKSLKKKQDDQIFLDFRKKFYKMKRCSQNNFVMCRDN